MHTALAFGEWVGLGIGIGAWGVYVAIALLLRHESLHFDPSCREHPMLRHARLGAPCKPCATGSYGHVPQVATAPRHL